MLVLEEEQEIKEPRNLLPFLKWTWVVLAVVLLGADFTHWLRR